MSFQDLCQQFLTLVTKAKGIVILTHRDPDFDAIGSVLALHSQLQSHGFRSAIWAMDEISDQFSFLPGIKGISSHLPDDFSFDTLIVMDATDLSRVRQFKALGADPRSVTVINIDHHSDNTLFGDLNIVEHISSVGELFFNICCALQWPLTTEEATCLYAAIAFDTGRFLYSNTTAQTFEVASDLVQLGADPYVIGQRLYENQSVSTFTLLQYVLQHLYYEDKYRYVYTKLPKQFAKVEFKVIDFIRQLKEYAVAIVFQELETKAVKVNLRSKNEFNVARFAKKFGGGGHPQAAGILINGTLDEVSHQVIKALNADLLDFYEPG